MTDAIDAALSRHPSVRTDRGCLVWQGPRSGPSGYGLTRVDGKAISVHRAAALKKFGAIPKGIDVCHTCDVRPCHEPDHLFLGTRSDNMRDAAAKKRLHFQINPPHGERHPKSKLTDAQVKYILTSKKTNAELGRELGYDSSNISHIRCGKLWAKTWAEIRALTTTGGK